MSGCGLRPVAKPLLHSALSRLTETEDLSAMREACEAMDSDAVHDVAPSMSKARGKNSHAVLAVPASLDRWRQEGLGGV